MFFMSAHLGTCPKKGAHVMLMAFWTSRSSLLIMAIYCLDEETLFLQCCFSANITLIINEKNVGVTKVIYSI